MRAFGLIVLLALVAVGALSGCASISPTVGPISGTVNIGAKPPMAVVETITLKCAPPPQLLLAPDDFAPYTPMTFNQALDRWATDIVQSRLTRQHFIDLQIWIKANCR